MFLHGLPTFFGNQSCERRDVIVQVKLNPLCLKDPPERRHHLRDKLSLMFFLSAQIACNRSFFSFFLPSSASRHGVLEDRYFPWQDFSESKRFKCRWNNAVLAANGRPRGHNYSIWRRPLPPQPWQVRSNVIVRCKAVARFVFGSPDNLRV